MDVTLNYIDKGTGTPLILLHGNGENLDYFTAQTEYFSKKYRVIALDTRGHGKSERGTAPFTIRQFAEDLHDFMEAHDIPKAHILGFSDGGNIALCFALKYPHMVERLILNGANLDGSGVKTSIQLPIILGYRLASLFAKKSPQAKANAEMLGLMVNDPALSPEQLHSLHIKTLVIVGTKDMIREKHTRLIQESLPDARLVLLPGSHFIASECPEAFNAAVAQFLEESFSGK